MYLYSNETSVGEAIKTSGLKREEVFVITKLWRDDHGFDQCKTAFHESLKRWEELQCVFSADGKDGNNSWPKLLDVYH